MKYKKMRTSIPEERQQENLAADLAEQKALTAYVAMMADVDLPEDNQEGAEEYEA